MSKQAAIPDPGRTPAFRGAWHFLSNMHEAPFKAGGQTWPTVEHFYYAMKTVDPDQREHVRTALTPVEAKERGRKVTRRPDWYEIKLDVMRFALARKFAPGSELARKLIATYPDPIVERNTWRDTFWGVCGGKGENHLGRLLMERRAHLLKGAVR